MKVYVLVSKYNWELATDDAWLKREGAESRRLGFLDPYSLEILTLDVVDEKD